MTNVNSIQDLLTKLGKLNFIKVDNKSLIADNGFEVSYSTKFLGDPPHRSDYPVQIVIQIRKEGKHVFTWGCEDNESNRLFVNFYIVAESNAYGAEMKVDDTFQEEGKKLFNEL